MTRRDRGAEPRVRVPDGLRWLERTPEGRRWLESLPDLLGECAERWDLRLGEPFAYAFASLALPVTRSDSSQAVLKLQFPDRESTHEAEALARWDGSGAIRLLAHDAARRALLIERCVPGTPLSDAGPDEALDVAVRLLPRLWIPAGHPFVPLADEAGWWNEDLERQWERAARPFERRLLDAAREALRELPPTQGEQVLLHQDFHSGNVLRAEREPWLTIDAKPLAGEREFAVAPLVRDAALGATCEAVLHRFDRLTSDLGLDRARARGWTIGQTIAWCFDGDRALPGHVDVARWLLETR